MTRIAHAHWFGRRWVGHFIVRTLSTEDVTAVSAMMLEIKNVQNKSHLEQNNKPNGIRGPLLLQLFYKLFLVLIIQFVQK